MPCFSGAEVRAVHRHAQFSLFFFFLTKFNPGQLYRLGGHNHPPQAQAGPELALELRSVPLVFRPQRPGCTAACPPRAQVLAAESHRTCTTPKRRPRTPTVASPTPAASPPRPSRQQPSRDADGTNPLGRLVEEKEDSGTGNPLVSSESACALSTLRVYVTIRAACRPAPGFAGRHVGSWRE